VTVATFTWTHDYGASLDEEPLVHRAQFGDGYEQVAAAGINNRPRKWSLNFENRDYAEADALVAFLRAHHLVFDWTDPDGAPGRWQCKSWQQSHPAPLVKSVAATFEEVFGR
jgi:phage-related protein